MFIVKGGTTTVTREVELVQGSKGVTLKVNGLPVLRLDDDCDLVVMVRGITKELTGLNDDYGKHAQTVWAEDKATSTRINRGGVV